jgi:SpoIID/LytB domain protein
LAAGKRLLSDSHLKSSAFVPVYLGIDGQPSDEEWTVLRLEGYGWGHGVGLCQIGAAVMASEGYGYKEILEHYYPGTTL